MRWFIYLISAVLLVGAELLYFHIAKICVITDKPNERSSHSKTVLRGGGIIFTLAVLVWAIFDRFGLFPQIEGFSITPWFVLGLVIVAAISFIDDTHPLPSAVRMPVQFIGAGLMLYQLGILVPEMWWIAAIALVVCVGMMNFYNFMDGINGITGGYSLAVLLPILIVDISTGAKNVIPHSFIVVMIIADLVFCWFNFRPRNKARCFSGDVGSIAMALVLLFMTGKIMLKTGDVTYFIFFAVYVADACMTLVHRIMLHEKLTAAHRKHAYQLLCNELGMSHVVVSLMYTGLQLLISVVFILLPDTPLWHWLYVALVAAILATAYILFMKKYYHLHAEYLETLEK